MENIKWRFFDLGSTLVDESECLKERCKVIIEQNNLDADEFYKKFLNMPKKMRLQSGGRHRILGLPCLNGLVNLKDFILMLKKF